MEWTKLKNVPAGFADGVDTDTTYSAGNGLSLSGTAFSAAYGGSGGDYGSSNSLSRFDHLHDARYFTQGQLNTTGTLNLAGNPVDWTRLKGVPEGFADGVDTDTTYSAGITNPQSAIPNS